MDEKGMQSVSRIFMVIEQIANSKSGLGITELSKATNLPKSTIHRIANALINDNYLKKSDDDKYKLGYRFISISKQYVNSLDLCEIAGPYLRNLANNLNATAHIAIRNGIKAVYVEKIQPYSYVSMYSEIGKSIDLYCSALGKSLMLGMTENELEEYIKRLRITKYTPNTLDKEQLVIQINIARKTKLTFDNAEHETHMYCIATPIYNHTNNTIASISISSNDCTLLHNKDAMSQLKRVGEEISKQFGY